MRRTLFALLFLAACSTTTPPPSSTPHPLPPLAKPPNALHSAAAPRAIALPKIRVGLLSDQSTVVFPRTSDGYAITTSSGAWTLRRGFTITAPLANAAIRYAVQVSAISDQASASAFVEKLRTETGLRVDMRFDPASGTYKVLAGDFETAEAAVPSRSQLTDRGYGKDLLVVRRPSDQPFENWIELVDDEGDHSRLAGPSVLIQPLTGETISIDNQPYRSAASVFINPRGLLNVINELNLEEYLYGVVPAEMGPTIYDEVEALKAQAVAARTYAIRNLGQFAAEGYDICPGPACQAYKGFSGEHDLSTRAVRETSGLVMTYNGEPIDALYTATCGGETSDVATMFPGRSEPYLKAVRCVELSMLAIAGRADSGLLTEQQVNARLFAALAGLPESSPAWSAREVAQAVVAAMRIGGWAETTLQAPASSRRGDVLRYMASIMALDRDGRVLTLPEDRKYWFAQTPGPDAAPYLAASFLVKYGINPAQFIDRIGLDQPMPREELYALLLGWIREHGVLSDVEGKILKLEGRRITLKQKGETFAHTLPDGIPVFRRLGDRLQEYASVPVLLGDRATLVLSPSKKPVAAIVTANYDGAAFDRTSSFSNWTRSYRADELVTSINRRNPIRQLVDIEPLVVDASQRVAEMQVTAEGGRTFILRGLPIRWSLNVPDNLFVYDKTRDPDGVDRYTFFGKGWGHGTGMCQVGAYGMAFRGWTYDRILKHFYTGIEIVRR